MRNLPFPDFAANAVWLQLVLMALDLIAWSHGVLLEGQASTGSRSGCATRSSMRRHG